MKKRHALTALMVAAALPIAACGDDDDDKAGGDSAPAKVALELTGSGKNVKLTGPASVEAGPAEITLKNSAKEDGGAQIIRIEGNHTAQDALAAGEAWGEKGKVLPAWVRLEGGALSTAAGKSSTVTQTLRPGKYVVADIESNSFAEFEATGDGGGGGEEPEAPAARIDAVDYGFESSGLKAGKNTVTFENKGKEPHFIVGLPIKPGKTIEDVKKFAQTEKGEPPFDEKNGPFDTAIIDGGLKQTIEVELKKGKYALLCFIPDRKGGPPHVAKGMVAEAVVE